MVSLGRESFFVSVVKVTDSNYIAEVVNSAVPVLVDFSAVWCGPCQRLAPTVHEVAEEAAGTYKVCEVDVDEAPGLVQQFRIMSVPTLVVMSEGKEAVRMVGGQSKEQILAALKQAKK